MDSSLKVYWTRKESGETTKECPVSGYKSILLLIENVEMAAKKLVHDLTSHILRITLTI